MKYILFLAIIIFTVNILSIDFDNFFIISLNKNAFINAFISILIIIYCLLKNKKVS